MGKMRETAPREAVGRIIDTGPVMAKWKSWPKLVLGCTIDVGLCSKREILASGMHSKLSKGSGNMYWKFKASGLLDDDGDHMAADFGSEVAEHGLILEELERIFQSAMFQSSSRCQEMLSFLVKNSLNGQRTIKERVIAVEVFGRSENYDPSSDSIVRVAVHDTRRRLSEYYLHGVSQCKVKITLPSGSYIPKYELIDRSSGLTHPRLNNRWLLVSGLAVLLVAAATLISHGSRRTISDFDLFWDPLLSSNRPIMICLNTWPMLVVDAPGSSLTLQSLPRSPLVRYPMVLSPSEKTEGEVIVTSDAYTGVGAATTLYRLGVLFASHGKLSVMRLLNTVTYSELSEGPTVLVGGLGTDWVAETLRDFPFEVASVRIRDRQQPGRQWEVQRSPDGNVIEDYAIVARLRGNAPGNPIILVAGLSQNGTGAASEFLVNQNHMSIWLRTLPKDWQRRDVAAIIKVRVNEGKIGPSQVVTSRVF